VRSFWKRANYHAPLSHHQVHRGGSLVSVASGVLNSYVRGSTSARCVAYLLASKRGSSACAKSAASRQPFSLQGSLRRHSRAWLNVGRWIRERHALNGVEAISYGFT
jgi:hypothetical protein